MPLSEHEQRVLEQMERALMSDDPRLANTLQSSPRRSGWHYVIATGVVIVGLLLLILGAALPMVLLGVLGFVVMFGGVVYALHTPKRRGPVGVVRAGGTVRKAGQAKPAKRSYLTRLEERWDRRREQDGR